MSSAAGTSIDPRGLREAIQRRVLYSLGKRWQELGSHDLFMAVSLATRDLLIERMIETESGVEPARAMRV